MIKGLIFDFNGVIVDDYPIQKEAWNYISQVIRKKSVTDLEMINVIRGVPAKDTVSWMSNNSLSPERLNKIVEEKATMVKKLFAQSSLFCLNKGLAEFLDELKFKNIPRTIATSSSLEDMQFSFSRLGLNKWFDINLVIYNDGSYKGKPAPDPYLKAAAKLNLSPSECAVFEDAVSGIKSAHAAGSDTIVAVGSDERLKKLNQLMGVKICIHNFTEINLDNLLNVE